MLTLCKVIHYCTVYGERNMHVNLCHCLRTYILVRTALNLLTLHTENKKYLLMYHCEKCLQKDKNYLYWSVVRTVSSFLSKYTRCTNNSSSVGVVLISILALFQM